MGCLNIFSSKLFMCVWFFLQSLYTWDITNIKSTRLWNFIIIGVGTTCLWQKDLTNLFIRVLVTTESENSSGSKAELSLFKTISRGQREKDLFIYFKTEFCCLCLFNWYKSIEKVFLKINKWPFIISEDLFISEQNMSAQCKMHKGFLFVKI